MLRFSLVGRLLSMRRRNDMQRWSSANPIPETAQLSLARSSIFRDLMIRRGTNDICCQMVISHGLLRDIPPEPLGNYG